MTDTLHDTGFWVAISFFLFLFIAFRLGRSSITQALDSRIAVIRTEIETAESLRVEAQELLAQYQRKQKDAENEAAEIIAYAKEHAEKIKAKAEEDLAESMARREAQLTERLARVEENALADIRLHAATLTTAAAEVIITQSLDGKAAETLMEKSIKDISGHLKQSRAA